MRPAWHMWIFAAVFLGAASLTAQEPEPAAGPPNEAPADPAFREPNPIDSSFPARPSLGSFQPTDIGLGDEEPHRGPMPPQILSPEPDAAPAGGEQPRPQFDEVPQDVAPAQFQSPASPKAAAEPKTTVIPKSAAPAFQPVEPEGETKQPESKSLAQSLYQQAITKPASGALTGSPLALQEALTRRADSSRYAEFVKAYWELSRSLGAYYESVQGASELSRLPQPRQAIEQGLLEAARAAAEADLRQRRLHAIAAQLELAEQFSSVPSQAPLPADLPLVSAYKSKFEAVFSGRTPPRGARRLHETFEPRQALIEARAAEVVAVENAFAALAEAYADGQAPLDAVLRQHEQLQAARHGFLRSVYDYNAAIADYAWLAAGPGRSPETIASMLVERKPATASENVAPANFTPPMR
jgi:hypothetical protein